MTRSLSQKAKGGILPVRQLKCPFFSSSTHKHGELACPTSRHNKR
jgi:hypothetical protein